jgi:hypothetical protein
VGKRTGCQSSLVSVISCSYLQLMKLLKHKGYKT